MEIQHIVYNLLITVKDGSNSILLYKKNASDITEAFFFIANSSLKAA